MHSLNLNTFSFETKEDYNLEKNKLSQDGYTKSKKTLFDNYIVTKYERNIWRIEALINLGCNLFSALKSGNWTAFQLDKIAIIKGKYCQKIAFLKQVISAAETKTIDELKGKLNELDNQKIILDPEMHLLSEKVSNLENNPTKEWEAVQKELGIQRVRQREKTYSYTGNNEFGFQEIVNEEEKIILDQIMKEQDEIKQKLHPELYDSEQLYASKQKQIAELDQKIDSLKGELVKSYLPIAKQCALKIDLTGKTISSDPVEDIDLIRKSLKLLTVNELRKYVQPTHKKEINSLVEKEKKKGAFRLTGGDSRNRDLLTSEKSLHNPEIILAIFALEALAATGDSEAGELLLIEGSKTLSKMIFFGFHSDPLLLQLESLPINGFANPDPTAWKCLEEYIRRKNPSATFLPVMKAISKVAKNLNPSKNTTSFSINSNLDSYNIKDWGKYREVYTDIKKTIQSEKDLDKLLKNLGGWDSYELIEQSKKAINNLIKFFRIPHGNYFSPETLFVILKEITNQQMEDELIDQICRSWAFVENDTSHYLDRLHFIAALLDTGRSLETSDGVPWTSSRILDKVIDRLADNPSEEYAITAEQMYIRIMSVKKTLDDLLKKG